MTPLEIVSQFLGLGACAPLLDRHHHHQLLKVFGGPDFLNLVRTWPPRLAPSESVRTGILNDQRSIGELLIPSLRWVRDWCCGWTAGDPERVSASFSRSHAGRVCRVDVECKSF